MSDKKPDKRNREKENSKKHETPGVDAEMETFVTTRHDQVLHCNASLKE